MNVRALALGAMVGFVVAIAPACSPPKCGPSNCEGCCDASGTCVKKPDNGLNSTCGSAGNACVNCMDTGSTCNPTSNTCTAGGTGGGTGGGSGGGGGTTCDGCRLVSGTCMPLAAQSTSNCGAMGDRCQPCAAGQLCQAGACVIPDGGAVQVGSPCTTDTQCIGIPLSATDTQAGIRPFCKKTTLTAGADAIAYPEGYCSKRCLGGPNACGTDQGATGDNRCVFFGGSFGELENMCFDGCTGNGDCRDGYACVNFGAASSTNPNNRFMICLPLQADGGLIDPDAGMPSAVRSGGPCGVDNDCRPPDTGQCLENDAGFPGGMCLSDCSITASDSFCGPQSLCDVQLIQNDGSGRGAFLTWTCFATCDNNQLDAGVVPQPDPDADAGTLEDGGTPPATDAGLRCRPGYECVEGNFGNVCVPG